MKSIATQLVETIATALQAIRQGKHVPGLPAGSQVTFNTTVKTVTRSLSAPRKDKTPILILTNSTTTTRHFLSDVRQAMMQVYVSGLIQSSDDRHPAADQIDALNDDVSMALSADPKWGGLARRSRIVSSNSTPEIEEPEAAFILEYNIDFIEIATSGSGSFGLTPIADNPAFPYGQRVVNALYNALLTATGIVYVERANIWPIPPEQVARQYTPGIWFKEQSETYEYGGSTDTTKRLNVSMALLAVDSNEETYLTTLDTWVSNLKLTLGQYADLSGLVNAIDIKEIRTTKSEFPLVHIEVDITVRYMQSFLLA